MAGLVPAIHVLGDERKTWMPATGAGMTVEDARNDTSRNTYPQPAAMPPSTVKITPEV
jgi:hypothetical protein